jgi:hypothetical protein
MAWPPTIPPANRTNATPQETNHPNDHNAISTALTDTVTKINGMLIGGASVVPYGSAVPAGAQTYIRAGAWTGTSDAGGQITVNYPGGSFSGGVIAVTAMPVAGCNFFAIPGRTAINQTGLTMYCIGPSGSVAPNTAIDLTIWAIGW